MTQRIFSAFFVCFSVSLFALGPGDGWEPYLAQKDAEGRYVMSVSGACYRDHREGEARGYRLVRYYRGLYNPSSRQWVEGKGEFTDWAWAPLKGEIEAPEPKPRAAESLSAQSSHDSEWELAPESTAQIKVGDIQLDFIPRGGRSGMSGKLKVHHSIEGSRRHATPKEFSIRIDSSFQKTPNPMMISMVPHLDFRTHQITVESSRRYIFAGELRGGPFQKALCFNTEAFPDNDGVRLWIETRISLSEVNLPAWIQRRLGADFVSVSMDLKLKAPAGRPPHFAATAGSNRHPNPPTPKTQAKRPAPRSSLQPNPPTPKNEVKNLKSVVEKLRNR